MDEHTRQHLHETPWVVWLPLVLLAIPSVIVGWLFVESALFGGHFGDSIFVLEAHNVLGGEMLAAFTSPSAMVVHGLTQAPTWLALAGVIVAWFLYLKRPELPGKIASSLKLAYNVLEAKYGFDRFNEIFFAGGARRLGTFFWRVGDMLLIDGLLVNGSAKLVGWVSSKVRRVQSGFLYEYAFWMIIGLVLFLTWIVHGWGANT
jgi:NADH-quinone oxidoreductase subunit L